MKFLQVLVFLSVFIVLLPGSMHAYTSGKLLRDYQRVSLYTTMEGSSKGLLGRVVILPEGSFDEKEAFAIIERLGNLPEKLLKRIAEKGIKVQLFNGKLTDQPNMSSFSGVKPRGYSSNITWDDIPGVGGTALVLVKIGASEKGKGHGSVNLELHELAHSVDRLLFDRIRDNKEFLSVWEEEKERLFPNRRYMLDYPEEYFAESFAMLYYSKSTSAELQEKAPNTYKFISRICNLEKTFVNGNAALK
ncbi:anthrax toxin lethal factor-related metalloendopeptidase [Bacillus massilinigeriensis]|uniref:anthrax toxin lethal factor-related metalloendopeptidase n=1 Tax=Bacillus mediterraneensis TaxID=1805474 RepID=UPI0008F8B742|nr:hypothetical protein [Bacillus mediterraneensis]